MKKKLIALLLCLAMIATMVVGCGSKDSEESSAAASDAETKVTVFWYDESDVFLSSVRTELNAELDKLVDEGLIAYDNQFAANDQAKQIDQIKTAIAGGTNLIVVNQVTSGASDTAEDIIAAAGDIPVIFFNRPMGTEGSELPVLEAHDNVCFIGTDAPEAGHIQGKMVGDYVLANYDTVDLNGDGVISYAMMKGEEGNNEAIYRTQYGVEDANIVLEGAGKPALKYFDEANTDCYQVDQGGKWSAAAAKEYMDTNFVTYNEEAGNMIELVICNNDGMAEGVVASLQEKGYNKEGAHAVPVFGVDATDNAISLIAEGAMVGTVKQDANGMAVAVAGAVKEMAGGAAPVDALAALSDDRFSLAADCASKLYVAYSPYTGE